jgi:hypothetical protein
MFVIPRDGRSSLAINLRPVARRTTIRRMFYTMNQMLRDHRFDDFAEAQCATFYAETMGRPGLTPGIISAYC